MKILVAMIYLILLLSLTVEAKPVAIGTLTSFADKYSYKDNRKTLATEKMYSAWKGCCEAGQPHSAVQAYQGPDSFHQIALFCDLCGTREVSQPQTDLCSQEFSHLLTEIAATKPSEALLAKLRPSKDGHPVVISDPGSPQKIRVSTGSLKCDGKGGMRLRVDLFVK